MTLLQLLLQDVQEREGGNDPGSPLELGLYCKNLLKFHISIPIEQNKSNTLQGKRVPIKVFVFVFLAWSNSLILFDKDTEFDTALRMNENE